MVDNFSKQDYTGPLTERRALFSRRRSSSAIVDCSRSGREGEASTDSPSTPYRPGPGRLSRGHAEDRTYSDQAWTKAWTTRPPLPGGLIEALSEWKARTRRARPTHPVFVTRSGRRQTVTNVDSSPEDRHPPRQRAAGKERHRADQRARHAPLAAPNVR